MSTDPKPCPFCGGRAVVAQVEHQGECYYSVGCAERTCRGGQPFESQRDLPKLLDSWNRRATCRHCGEAQ